MSIAFLQREPDAADRERWREALAVPPPASSKQERLVLFVFRVGTERYGIEPADIELAAPMPGFHSIPHRGSSLVGVVNVRGTVTLCFSLADVLGSLPCPAAERPMMLVLLNGGWRVACRVDEAFGVSEFDRSSLQPTPSSYQASGRTHLQGIMPAADGRDVGWLDASSLFEAFDVAAR